MVSYLYKSHFIILYKEGLLMRDYHSDEIGNVAILGHSGSGKTSVIEAMAYRSGKVSQIGTIKQGNTISDFDEEEKKRQSNGRTAKSISWIHLVPMTSKVKYRLHWLYQKVLSLSYQPQKV